MFLGAAKYDVILENFNVNSFNVDELEGVYGISECNYQHELLDGVGKTIYIDKEMLGTKETIEIDIAIQEKGLFVPEYEIAFAARLLKDGMPTKDKFKITDEIMSSITRMYNKSISDIEMLGWNSELKVVSNFM